MNGSQGRRDNAGKAPMHLLPFDALTEVAGVLGWGAYSRRKDGTIDGKKKPYGEHNWRKGLSWAATLASLLRHVARRLCGERVDPETGYLHSAHMACNALFLCGLELNETGTDDIVPPS